MLEFLELSWFVLAGLTWQTYAMLFITTAGVIYLQSTRESKKLVGQKIQTYKMVIPLTLIVFGFGLYGFYWDASVMGEQNMQAYQGNGCVGFESDDCEQLRKKLRWLTEFGFSLNEAAL